GGRGRHQGPPPDGCYGRPAAADQHFDLGTEKPLDVVLGQDVGREAGGDGAAMGKDQQLFGELGGQGEVVDGTDDADALLTPELVGQFEHELAVAEVE